MFIKLLSENLTYCIGWVIFHSLWQAVVFAILSGILLIVFRKKSSAFKYTLSNIALWAVLASAIITFAYYFNLYNHPIQTEFSALAKEVSVTVNSPKDMSIQVSEQEQIMSWENFRNYVNRNIYLIVTLWLLGASLFLIRLIGGIGYVYYLKSKMNFPPDEYWIELLEKLQEKSGVKKTINLVESALVRTPIVVGYLKPMILFPIGAINRLNTSEVEAILAHELAHIVRNDYVNNIIQSIIEALFYYHPAVWWMSAQIRAERENCCDDKAIEWCGNSLTYAKSLVSVQEMAYYSPQLSLAFSGKRKNSLLFRVQRILNQPQTKSYILEKLVATCLVFCCLVAISFGGNTVSQSYSTKDISSATIENVDNLQFLKYLSGEGVLDSLPIDGDIRDGHYSISDHLHNLELTVKDKSVVQFNLNGVEVPPSKIANFEGLIIKALDSEKGDSETLSTATGFGHSKAKNTTTETAMTINITPDDNGNIGYGNNSYSESNSDATNDEEVSTEDIERKVEQMNMEINQVHIEKANRNKLLKIRSELKKIDSRTNGDLDADELKELDIKLAGLDQELDGMKGDVENFKFNISIDKDGKDKGLFSYGISTNDKDKAQKIIIEQLRKDGLVNSDNIHFSIFKQNMVINDKNYTGKTLERYQKLIEKASGKPFDEKSVMAFNVHSVKGKMQDCSVVSTPPPPPPPPSPRDCNNDSRPFYVLVKKLVDNNKIQLKKKVKIYMTEDFLRVNGEKVNDDDFEDYKMLVFKELKSVQTMKISFVGQILGFENNFILTSGSLTQDFGSEE